MKEWHNEINGRLKFKFIKFLLVLKFDGHHYRIIQFREDLHIELESKRQRKIALGELIRKTVDECVSGAAFGEPFPRNETLWHLNMKAKRIKHRKHKD